MSLVMAVPEFMADAANDLARLGSTLDAAHAAALAPTTGILSAGADEVSTMTAELFSAHAAGFQALSARAAAFLDQHVQALHAAATSYADTEAASVAQLLLNLVNAPTDTLLGRPLIGNGANGYTNAQGVGTGGQAGGILYGNGGNGGNSTALGATGGAGGSAGLWGNGGNGGTGGPNAAGGAGGAPGLLGGTAGATGAAGTDSGNSVPLSYSGERLVTSLSVGSNGPTDSVIVDTGSTGLILPPQDVNTASLTHTGQTGTATYGDGGSSLTETYRIYDGTVNFGNGISTSSNTPIAVVRTMTENGVSYPASEAPAILGIGVNDGGPMVGASPVQYLTGNLSQGVLLDEPAGTMTFGPGTASSSTPYTTGAPVSTLRVSIDGGTAVSTSYAFIDSGGLYGDMPTNLHAPSSGGYVDPGTTVTVENSSGTVLYTTTVGSDQMSVVSSAAGGNFNSGIAPFLEDPIYLSYSPGGTGTMYFDT